MSYQVNPIDVHRLWTLLGFNNERLAEMRCIDMSPECPPPSRCLNRSFVDTFDDFLDWTRTWNSRGNCFVGRNARQLSHTVHSISCISLDIDPIREKNSPSTPEQMDECVAAGRKILESFPEGSLAFTGNGSLVLWVTTKPREVSKEFETKLAAFQEECRKIILDYRGIRIDDTQDSARLVKLLGAVSTKAGIRATRFLNLASDRGGGDKLFERVESYGNNAAGNKEELLAQSNYPSRSEADFALASFLAKKGFRDEAILNALSRNPLGRNERKDDHLRILQKVRAEYSSHPTNGDALSPMLHSPPSSLEAYRKSLEKRGTYDKPELPTGITEIDVTTYGLKRGEIYTVAARPAIGKSSYLLTMADCLLRIGRRVLILSTEMSFYQIWDRLFSIGCEVDGGSVGRGKFTPEEKRRVDAFFEKFKSYDVHVCDSFKPDLSTVTQAVQRIRPDVLMFDHIQHIAGSSGQHEVKALSDFTRGLKRLAMESNCAVVVASQLKRLFQSMDFKTKEVVTSKPMLSDLKGCGTIEEESAFVILLSNTGVTYDEHAICVQAELAKNRFGPNVQADLIFQKNLTKFKSKKEPV